MRLTLVGKQEGKSLGLVRGLVADILDDPRLCHNSLADEIVERRFVDTREQRGLE